MVIKHKWHQGQEPLLFKLDELRTLERLFTIVSWFGIMVALIALLDGIALSFGWIPIIICISVSPFLLLLAILPLCVVLVVVYFAVCLLCEVLEIIRVLMKPFSAMAAMEYVLLVKVKTNQTKKIFSDRFGNILAMIGEQCRSSSYYSVLLTIVAVSSGSLLLLWYANIHNILIMHIVAISIDVVGLIALLFFKFEIAITRKNLRSNCSWLRILYVTDDGRTITYHEVMAELNEWLNERVVEQNRPSTEEILDSLRVENGE